MQAGYIVVFCGNLAISFLNHTGSHKAKKEKKKSDQKVTSIQQFLRKGIKSRRTKNRDIKVEISCTTARAAVQVAFLFSLTITFWYLVAMKTVCCHYCYIQPDQTSNRRQIRNACFRGARFIPDTQTVLVAQSKFHTRRAYSSKGAGNSARAIRRNVLDYKC